MKLRVLKFAALAFAVTTVVADEPAFLTYKEVAKFETAINAMEQKPTDAGYLQGRVEALQGEYADCEVNRDAVWAHAIQDRVLSEPVFEGLQRVVPLPRHPWFVKELMDNNEVPVERVERAFAALEEVDEKDEDQEQKRLDVFDDAFTTLEGQRRVDVVEALAPQIIEAGNDQVRHALHLVAQYDTSKNAELFNVVRKSASFSFSKALDEEDVATGLTPVARAFENKNYILAEAMLQSMDFNDRRNIGIYLTDVVHDEHADIKAVKVAQRLRDKYCRHKTQFFGKVLGVFEMPIEGAKILGKRIFGANEQGDNDESEDEASDDEGSSGNTDW